MPRHQPGTLPATIGTDAPPTVWLLRDDTTLLGVYDTERGARIAQADARFQILCTLGRDMGRLNAITVTPAVVHSTDTDPARVTR